MDRNSPEALKLLNKLRQELAEFGRCHGFIMCSRSSGDIPNPDYWKHEVGVILRIDSIYNSDYGWSGRFKGWQIEISGSTPHRIVNYKQKETGDINWKGIEGQVKVRICAGMEQNQQLRREIDLKCSNTAVSDKLNRYLKNKKLPLYVAPSAKHEACVQISFRRGVFDIPAEDAGSLLRVLYDHLRSAK